MPRVESSITAKLATVSPAMTLTAAVGTGGVPAARSDRKPDADASTIVQLPTIAAPLTGTGIRWVVRPVSTPLGSSRGSYRRVGSTGMNRPSADDCAEGPVK